MPLRDNNLMASNFLEILTQLHDRNVDFVIVSGVAAALHGGSRVTFDLDVVPSLAPNSWMAAVDLLWALGARPRIPEPVERIRDVKQVRRWQREKGMKRQAGRPQDLLDIAELQTIKTRLR